MTAKNTGRLLSVYCPVCRKATDKISFNLLREAGKVTVHCPQCQQATYIEYNGKQAQIYHQDDGFERVYGEMTPSERKEFIAFMQGGKKD
jgi:endogenous inhibitor of DNA gyrase (YacG/DUF329 family)